MSDAKEKVKFGKSEGHQIYKTSDGKRVPWVTTILGVMNKPALVAAANKLGLEGKTIQSEWYEKAADAGSLAHFMIECHLKGQEADTSEFAKEQIDAAENAVIKFLSWWDGEGYMIEGSEVQLTSDTCRYGGTLDIVARRNGELHLIDLKTGKGIYDEMICQVAAYRRLWDEAKPEKIAKVVIARIGKECRDDDFDVGIYPETGVYWDVFAACQVLYEAVKAMKRTAR